MVHGKSGPQQCGNTTLRRKTRRSSLNHDISHILINSYKIIEKLIYSRLLIHIEKNNIMAHEQYGFRAHYSTEKATFSLINSILTAMNNKQIVGGIFCDLQKAFDSVGHKTSLEKLEFYGVKGICKTLIKSYLTDRYQRVVLGLAFESNNSSLNGKSIIVEYHRVRFSDLCSFYCK
jgi:hypothetical protein